MNVSPQRAPRLPVLLAAAAWAAVATPAHAQGLQIFSGDTAWLLTATALVLLMGIPGLAMFYGGLVRAKNALSMLTQVFAVVCLAAVIWALFGYSLAFTSGALPGFVGGFSKALLMGVGPDSAVPTTSAGVGVPEYGYIAFQMMFACITPAIIVGAFAERMRFQAMLLFIVLWIVLVYVPIAHMAWFTVAPDVLAEATRAAVAAAPGEPRLQAELALAKLKASNGLFVQWGALDFAGGTVVHISAGIAGLIGAIILGKRVGYGRDSMAPHNLTMTMAGAAMLWVGWLGFNAGSSLRADGTATLALLNSLLAPAAGALSWMIVEASSRSKPSALGLVSGLLAGLVAVTPAAGYVGPGGALLIGLVAGAACFVFSTSVKSYYQYDDSLDVFGIHCVAGVVGTLLLAVFASPALGGFGGIDQIKAGLGTSAYSIGQQLLAQAKAVVVTLAWSGLVSSQLYRIVDVLVGLRPEEDEEDQGLDIVDHGERAYNY
ncbi:MAG: ammonium transporter [Hyphomicrobiaceae bacterium]